VNNDKLFQQKMTANTSLWQQYVILRLITRLYIVIVDNKKRRSCPPLRLLLTQEL